MNTYLITTVSRHDVNDHFVELGTGDTWQEAFDARDDADSYTGAEFEAEGLVTNGDGPVVTVTGDEYIIYLSLQPQQ